MYVLCMNCECLPFNAQFPNYLNGGLFVHVWGVGRQRSAQGTLGAIHSLFNCKVLDCSRSGVNTGKQHTPLQRHTKQPHLDAHRFNQNVESIATRLQCNCIECPCAARALASGSCENVKHFPFCLIIFYSERLAIGWRLRLRWSLCAQYVAFI